MIVLAFEQQMSFFVVGSLSPSIQPQLLPIVVIDNYDGTLFVEIGNGNFKLPSFRGHIRNFRLLAP